MKILFCRNCHDLFRLDRDTRECQCGITKGRYIDNTFAIVTAQSVSIGLDNRTLAAAMRGDQTTRRALDCWMRPNEGELNPHTEVVAGDDWRFRV